MILDPGAVWRGLQEVHDGADPADVYARLTDESGDMEEAIENEFHDALEEAHDFNECREKNLTAGICHGFTCAATDSGRIMTDCPCTCHKDDER